jgi:hypothetical protein
MRSRRATGNATDLRGWLETPSAARGYVLSPLVGRLPWATAKVAGPTIIAESGSRRRCCLWRECRPIA